MKQMPKLSNKENKPMKKLISFLLLCFPVGIYAQPGMSQADMQQMMQQAQKMQACMAEIDQAALDRFADEARAVEREIKTLCRAGRREQAQDRALEFGRSVESNAEMKKMRQCSATMANMMPKFDFPTPEEMKQRHVCDQY